MKVKHTRWRIHRKKLVANINISTLHAIFLFFEYVLELKTPPRKKIKKKANFLFMLQAFIDFFHSFFMCTFCTFMHIILNEMSQEKYLPFAHKFFPSLFFFSANSGCCKYCTTLFLAPQRISWFRLFNLCAWAWLYVSLFSNECRL